MTHACLRPQYAACPRQIGALLVYDNDIYYKKNEKIWNKSDNPGSDLSG
jgi:hypothetical protein